MIAVVKEFYASVDPLKELSYVYPINNAYFFLDDGKVGHHLYEPEAPAKSDIYKCNRSIGCIH